MILYLSNATHYSVYNEYFKQGKINGGYQMQKFNSCMIKSLSSQEGVIAVSPLPYNNVKAERFEREIDGVKYIAIKNTTGKLHKILNVLNLIKEGKKIIKNKKPTAIICDEIAISPRLACKYLGKKYNIQTIGIITDFPGMLSVNEKDRLKGIKSMQKFDKYILLTEQMNSIVNPCNKSYVVIEGVCDSTLPMLYPKNDKKIIMYTGSLWENNAGIEYLVKGFLKANIENAELHFYGTGKLVDWLKEIEKKNQNVKYKGCVTNDEIVKLQTEATLLVNPRPSNEEFCKYSFPSKTIEYMLSGTPVLMTKLPGVPKEYFNYVYMIDKEDADGVCNALKEIFSKSEEELKEFGLQARNFIWKNKNPNKQGEKIVKILRENKVK